MAASLPPEAWDTHVHIFDPTHYPYSTERVYTPGTAMFSDLSSFNASLTSAGRGTNVVLVQPSPYSSDNSLIIAKLRQENGKQESQQKCSRLLRAIVVLDFDHVTLQELQDLHEIGVRGIRLNLESGGKKILIEELKDLMQLVVRRLKEANLQQSWFIQLFIPGETWKRKLNSRTHLNP